MGFRTVVVFYNDQCSEWSKCPDLGERIARAMNTCNNKYDGGNLECGGRVVECIHADTQTLALIDGYNLTPIAHSQYNLGGTENFKDVPLKLLKLAAEKLGYRLVKKAEK